MTTDTKHHNLIGFKSYTALNLAVFERHNMIDGISGFDLLRRHDGMGVSEHSLTEAQRRFVDDTERRSQKIEEGRKRILELLGLGNCRPGYSDYACEYVVNFDTGECADFLADPTEWVENWVSNPCPSAEWWKAHRRERELGVSEYWSFGTNADYIHFTPGNFDFPSDGKFPLTLPCFTRVVNGAMQAVAVVPYILNSTGEYGFDASFASTREVSR